MFVQNGWFCSKAKNYWLVIETLIRSEMFRPGWVGGKKEKARESEVELQLLRAKAE